MGNLFDIAVGGLVGLWELAVAPWTQEWWTCVAGVTLFILVKFTANKCPHLYQRFVFRSLDEASRIFYEAMVHYARLDLSH